MRIFATQSDGETDPSPIDFFKIIFLKTTMGISKMTEILQTTENSNWVFFPHKPDFVTRF